MISTDTTYIHMSKSTNGSLKKTLRESEQNPPLREPRGPSWVECLLVWEFHHAVQAGLDSLCSPGWPPEY